MLFNIDTNCSPELLYCLAQMGHGDELVIADRNFPATSTALQTCCLLYTSDAADD